ncbi:MAG: hypothetical protein QOJ81_416 [Chloroflexota bacterium]|jgi:hypothetical protein|nr:hypothetical protein [Chloroflexota bacterium]
MPATSSNDVPRRRPFGSEGRPLVQYAYIVVIVVIVTILGLLGREWTNPVSIGPTQTPAPSAVQPSAAP